MDTTQINKQSKYWVFTINNPVVEDTPVYDEETMDYLVYGKEEGTEGTPHWQCFVAFKKRKRRRQISSIFNRAFIECMKSTPAACATYCKKDGDYVEHGTCPLSKSKKQSNKMKRKWEKIYENAKKGDLDEIPKDVLIRYYHGIKRIKQDNYKPPPDIASVCGTWLYGPPGCGKTHYVKAMADVYDKPINKWWDAYNGEDNVLLDDVDHDNVKYITGRLKRWSDKYSFPAEQKGTMVWLRPKKIFVTSNYKIEDLWVEERHVKALQRRFNEVDYVAFRALQDAIEG